MRMAISVSRSTSRSGHAPNQRKSGGPACVTTALGAYGYTRLSGTGAALVIGTMLILSVLYLPGGLASLRAETFKAWWRDTRDWAKDLKRELSGEKKREEARLKKRAKEQYLV